MCEKICYAKATKITGPWTYRGIPTDKAKTVTAFILALSSWVAGDANHACYLTKLWSIALAHSTVGRTHKSKMQVESSISTVAFNTPQTRMSLGQRCISHSKRMITFGVCLQRFRPNHVALGSGRTLHHCAAEALYYRTVLTFAGLVH